jgi:hypothetical protein
VWTTAKLIHEWAIALGYVIDKSTNLMYTSALNSYINFCTLHVFPLKPTNETMLFFVIYMSHHITPKLVDSYLSGIRNQLESAFHLENGPGLPVSVRSVTDWGSL